MKKILAITTTIMASALGTVLVFLVIPRPLPTPTFTPPAASEPTIIPTPTPTPEPTPTPTPRPLTFAEMNELYGPCAYVPTLMYHHVQDMNEAKTKEQGGLTVDTGTFRTQMQYIHDRGYNTIRPIDLINFFDIGSPLPGKPMLITFDDGYDDFGTNAAPILREMGLQGTAFIPTGLMENPGYMNWGKVMEISGWGNIYFANHTWSHHNVATTRKKDEDEISTADKQLGDRALNPFKVFAYPYGFSNDTGISVLQQLDYKIAFTTYPGSTLCKQQRFTLPRIRIGNSGLGTYGL
ncbi:polysaccharide deacetylase family protein [Candidatus Gottesmanbacteria bacterium]|nr:polysaccharide deacetylase family protein [Candidatus Gottesmanbacteria bacterium]